VKPGRVVAIDWLRGLAVLVMIQCHAMALLRPELRAGQLYGVLTWIDGLVAPAFILAAGFSLSLVQVRAAASPGPRAGRVLRTLRRIAEVLLVGALLTALFFPVRIEPKWLLRIDILQCIGISLLVALPILVALAPHPRALRWVALALAALVFGLAPLAEAVRGPLAPFLNNKTGSVFAPLPWGGYVYLGAALGATTAAGGARSLALWLLGLAAVGIALWALTPQLAAVYPPHEFWVTNPANHARRITQVAAVALVLLGAEQLVTGSWRASAPVRFVEAFGMSSLAAYFFHETLLYVRVLGFSFHKVWGDKSSWPQYWLLLALLIAATWALTVAVDRIYKIVDRRIPAPLGAAAT